MLKVTLLTDLLETVKIAEIAKVEQILAVKADKIIEVE